MEIRVVRERVNIELEFTASLKLQAEFASQELASMTQSGVDLTNGEQCRSG